MKKFLWEVLYIIIIYLLLIFAGFIAPADGGFISFPSGEFISVFLTSIICFMLFSIFNIFNKINNHSKKIACIILAVNIIIAISVLFHRINNRLSHNNAASILYENEIEHLNDLGEEKVLVTTRMSDRITGDRTLVKIYIDFENNKIYQYEMSDEKKKIYNKYEGAITPVSNIEQYDEKAIIPNEEYNNKLAKEIFFTLIINENSYGNSLYIVNYDDSVFEINLYDDTPPFYVMLNLKGYARPSIDEIIDNYRRNNGISQQEN